MLVIFAYQRPIDTLFDREKFKQVILLYITFFLFRNKHKYFFSEKFDVILGLIYVILCLLLFYIFFMISHNTDIFLIAKNVAL